MKNKAYLQLKIEKEEKDFIKRYSESLGINNMSAFIRYCITYTIRQLEKQK